MRGLARLLRSLPLLLVSPILIAVPAVSVWICDLLWLAFGRRKRPADRPPSARAASVVIPNWNGCDLLEKYLPSVVHAMGGNPDNEIIIVDNASSDGSRELLAERFPHVKVLRLEKNLGFGGGSNAGFRAARNDIVVLLNSDMRVEPGFLQPLLNGFIEENVFSVSCQIFFSDPAKVREETGLTQAWWESGGIRVRHRADDKITTLYPCFYGGGGSSAYDRKKFLELGGFDELLAPFYMEDTDLGYLAWKRGWKVLYEPRSVVYHEHRGTIGKRFRPQYIREIVRKNFLLFTWKNIHDPRRLVSHLCFTYLDALVSLIAGESPERTNLAALWRAFRQVPGAARSRWRARSLAIVPDEEAFARPMAGYYRDRFDSFAVAPARPGVLFLSPYPLCPPDHGGGVFMNQTVRELARHCDVHLIALLDRPQQRSAHAEMDSLCASTEYMVRLGGKPVALGSITPHAVTEFANSDLEWLIHRQLYLKKIDVFQIEYTNMGQYAGRYHHIVNALFEHDIYFQSIARGLRQPGPMASKASPAFEYLKALRFELEMLRKIDRIQVCSRANQAYLTSFLPEARDRIQSGLRAGIDASRYCFQPDGREPGTMLFLGSFRHLPNRRALEWFLEAVLPHVLAERPGARLIVVGSEPPPVHSLGAHPEAVELRGFVDDVREPLSRYSVFLCPILSGSGVRVKLLEAFASGIPSVSTRIGAEGLAEQDGEFCFLTDDPTAFADRVLQLLRSPSDAAEMVKRARHEVEENWDTASITARLIESYRTAMQEKRRYATSAASRP